MRSFQTPLDRQQKLHYVIEVYTEETLLTQVEDNGSEKRYVVSPNQLQRILDLPTPPVTLRPEPGLLHMTADGETESYLYSVKRKDWTASMRVNSEKKPRVVKFTLPNFLLKSQVRRIDRKIIEISAWTHTGRKFSPESVLYEMPLPNFSERGPMCMGDVLVKVGQKESVKDAALKAVFDSEFNNHNGTVGKKGIGFLKFIKENKGFFPFSKLTRCGVAKKVLPEVTS